MRRERACMSRIVLAGLLTLGLRGWSAEPPAKPATKAPAVKMDPVVAKRIAILKDLELDDGERATARDELAGRTLVGKDSVKALNHLGRTSENDNILTSQTRRKLLQNKKGKTAFSATGLNVSGDPVRGRARGKTVCARVPSNGITHAQRMPRADTRRKQPENKVKT